jgi:hypothetical protein
MCCLEEEIYVSSIESKLGVDGWEAQIVNQKKLKNCANAVFHIKKVKNQSLGI